MDYRMDGTYAPRILPNKFPSEARQSLVPYSRSRYLPSPRYLAHWPNEIPGVDSPWLVDRRFLLERYLVVAQ